MATASLILETESMTVFSGRVSIGLYKSQNGQWIQSVSPAKGNSHLTTSNWISPNTARRWLEKHSFNLQIREYFGISNSRLQPERQVLVAERKPPNSNSSNDLVSVERLYHHPQKGWCLQQTKESVVIPLTGQEAASLVRSLQLEKRHTQTPLPVLEQYIYEGEHSQYGGIKS
ncbi:MAG: hypothetical protein ABIJ59_03425 [Pseudomonadota bacterium]